MRPGRGSMTVLVADDDLLVREMISSILQDAGFAVETAENGSDALRKYSSSGEIGLIVSDMNMPETDGLELIKIIRDSGSDVPIIILTGDSEVTKAIQALRTGASDYILKDETIQDTIGISVDQVLEKHYLKKENQRLLEELARRNEKLENEKALAQKVQKNILPKELVFHGFEVESFYRPSDKIGGDFFDAWESGGRIHFMIGDVSGHSTSSALIMAVSKGILQSLGYTLDDPREIVSTANRMICDIVSDSGMFLTLLYGIFDRTKNEFGIVSAGHNEVFLVAGKDVNRIGPTGPVIGWDSDDKWECSRYEFEPGMCLLLYTDGLTEVRDSNGIEFGESRLESLLCDSQSEQNVLNTIVKNVEVFCNNEFHDDLTLLAIRRIADG